MTDVWLPSLKTDTPQAAFELADRLSRMGVKLTQPSD
ncbi:hexameric tyrosine-coordinated heme protein [Bradyrhizobium sp.]